MSSLVDSAEACDGPGSTPVFHASQTGTAAMAMNAATTSNLSLTGPPPGDWTATPMSPWSAPSQWGRAANLPGA